MDFQVYVLSLNEGGDSGRATRVRCVEQGEDSTRGSWEHLELCLILFLHPSVTNLYFFFFSIFLQQNNDQHGARSDTHLVSTL